MTRTRSLFLLIMVIIIFIMVIGCTPQDEVMEPEEKEAVEETEALKDNDAQVNEVDYEAANDEKKGEEQIRAKTDATMTHEVNKKINGLVERDKGEEWWKMDE